MVTEERPRWLLGATALRRRHVTAERHAFLLWIDGAVCVTSGASCGGARKLLGGADGRRRLKRDGARLWRRRRRRRVSALSGWVVCHGGVSLASPAAPGSPLVAEWSPTLLLFFALFLQVRPSWSPREKVA